MSATKMNVFYKGLKNPFKVSGGGIADENLEVKMDNGKITKTGPNTYDIEPNELDEQGNGKTKIYVYQKIGNDRRLVGTSNWRVKRVPDPVAKVGNSGGGDIRKESLVAQDGVLAVLEDFLFDYKYTVTEFEVQTTESGFNEVAKSTSNRFTPRQKELIRNANTKSIVYIGNIKARGDDGTFRDLKSIAFTIR
jgi:gliding motility-associated protein GldM